MDRVIKLNIGGDSFVALSSTLQESGYFKNLLEDSMTNTTIVNGDERFIDRSGQLFAEVLCFLRTSTMFCKDLNKLKSLQVEAEYYAIPKMMEEVKAKIATAENNAQLPQICIKSMEERGEKRKFSLIEDLNGSTRFYNIIDIINIRPKCSHNYNGCNCAKNVVPHFVSAHPKKT